MRDDYAELRRDGDEPFRRQLADHMYRQQGVAILGRNRLVDVRQVGRKCALTGAALISAPASAQGSFPSSAT